MIWLFLHFFHCVGMSLYHNIVFAYLCYSNRSHFGLIQSMGGGKYICHVFAEYKVSTSYIDT